MSNDSEYQVESSVGVVFVMLSKQRLMLAAIIVNVCVVADINFSINAKEKEEEEF